MKLFLTGYMGSGKSRTGIELARQLGFTFVDLDTQIEQMQGKRVSSIFDDRGELYFRKLETEVLKDVLEDNNSLIVALGGGTPCYGNNLELIKQDHSSKTIYLKGSVDLLTERLFLEKDSRPVISHLELKEDLDEFIRKHLFERSYYYLQSDYVISVEGKTPQEIAGEIINLLQ